MRYLLIIIAMCLFATPYLLAQSDSLTTDVQDTMITDDTPGNMAVVDGDTILLDAPYFNSFAKPIIAMSGDVVVVNTDSIHLVNNKRFLFYEDLRNVIGLEDNCNDQIKEVIARYEASLERNENDFNSLLDNCNRTSDLTLRVLETTEQSLSSTKTLLTDTQTSLAHANDLLKEARKTQKASRRKGTLNKVLIGVGAAAVGVLVGVIAE